MKSLHNGPNTQLKASAYPISITIYTIISCFHLSHVAGFHHPIAFTTQTQLEAKRRDKKQQDTQFNRWYDAVSQDSTPDDIFWEEMDRDRLMNKVGTEAASTSEGEEERTLLDSQSAETILAKMGRYMVEDNVFDEDFDEFYDEDEDEEERLEEQLEEIEKEGWTGLENSYEVWDHWGSSQDGEEEVDDSILQIDPGKGEEYRLDDDAEDTSHEEQEDLQRLSKIQLLSPRLENARQNPRAEAYFTRPPDQTEGFDRMWVCAIDEPCRKNLAGVFRDYGIQFADNFADWESSSGKADDFVSIEDLASFKARAVYNVTGLPCIASRTSFEVESVRVPSPRAVNPRLTTGYKFNNVGYHIDQLAQALLTEGADPSRRTRFKSCLCFYDGEMEIFDYGELDCDLYFCNSLRTYIPMNIAIHEMCNTLKIAYSLRYQRWLRSKQREVFGQSGMGASALKLRDRVLKDSRVLPNDIIDVSKFMNSMVDVGLMDECGNELAQQFVEMKPTKILTVATTGLVIAIPMAKYLQIPVVYARKQRSIVMADTYQAIYSSKTVGQNRELLVMKQHLSEEDRILIVDDFLSSGSSQDALLRIVGEAGAKAVGVGVVLEKVYEAGRQALSGFDVPIKSMVRVASVKGGMIQLLEEEGFEGI